MTDSIVIDPSTIMPSYGTDVSINKDEPQTQTKGDDEELIPTKRSCVPVKLCPHCALAERACFTQPHYSSFSLDGPPISWPGGHCLER